MDNGRCRCSVKGCCEGARGNHGLVETRTAYNEMAWIPFDSLVLVCGSQFDATVAVEELRALGLCASKHRLVGSHAPPLCSPMKKVAETVPRTSEHAEWASNEPAVAF